VDEKTKESRVRVALFLIGIQRDAGLKICLTGKKSAHQY